jgi:large subunit ribosomal protein L11
MAKKKIERKIKLQIPAGRATPAPPVGTVLGPAGVNIGDFVQKFNAATAQMGDMVIPVELSVYSDRSFDFILKTPPAANLIMKAIGIEKGSGKNLVSKAGKISQAQIRAIAEQKMPDLNATDLEAASRIIAGTARSMGVEVVD